MADGRWRISVTAPDWGQDHLSLEAVVAYVDGELAPGAQDRAVLHLEQCVECVGQVRAQRQARAEIRRAASPSLSSGLLSSLRAIPQHAELPGQPAGLAMSPEGQLVSVLRPDRAGFPAMLGEPVPPVEPPHRLAARLRVGTGVAVSGLALGALAFGLPSSSSGSPAAPAAPSGIVNGGPLLGSSPTVLNARLELGPNRPSAEPEGPGPAAHIR